MRSARFLIDPSHAITCTADMNQHVSSKHATDSSVEVTDMLAKAMKMVGGGRGVW